MDFYGTLGAACADFDMLTDMFRAGMTGVRLNLSHTGLAECAHLLKGIYHPAARAAGVEPKLIHDVSFSVPLTSLNRTIPRFIHVAANGKKYLWILIVSQALCLDLSFQGNEQLTDQRCMNTSIVTQTLLT